MKKIHKITDKKGGFMEVCVLDRNTDKNCCAEDLIWFHFKRPLGNKTYMEDGFTITPYEAELISGMLFLGVQEILKRYKLYHFKVPKTSVGKR